MLDKTVGREGGYTIVMLRNNTAHNTGGKYESVKKLAAEQQQSPLVKDIEREYKKEKVSSVLKEARRLSIAMGLGAILAGLGMVDNIMKNRVNDAKFLGIGLLGLALLAVADVRKLKNTVLSAENRAILNVIKPYLDDDEKDYAKNIDESDGYKIGMNGTMGGTIAMSYFIYCR